MTRLPRTAAVAMALATALALAGCASPPDVAVPAPMRDAASLGLAAGAAASVPAIEAQWWRAFGDPQLDALVDQALAGHPSLRVARSRLARAQAVTGVADAALLPQVNAAAEATRQRFTRNGMVPAPLAGSVRESGLLQLSASWELDFFGRYRAALDAALGQARAAQAEADAAGVLLAGNLVRAWVQLARVQAQLGVAERTLAQRGEVLALVKDRVAAGLDSQLELRQAEGAVPDARAQVEALREQAQLARNALAALAGRPGGLNLPADAQLAALRPLAVPAVIPADLLGRRADVAAARARVEAAGAEVDSARAQFYPNVNLAAFAGLSSIGLGRLADGGSTQWGLTPAIRLPLFDAGRLRANLRGKAADLDAAIAAYDATVIDAVREAADAAASSQGVARQQAQQREAQQGAEAAYDLAVQRYRAGLGNYLQVLAAENAVLAQRRAAVDLAARALEAQAGLARALGGGWTDRPDALAAAPAPATKRAP
ncbi:efflux transporter outer membrane subunit [Ramlibacter sp. MAHUQ-53]|uniref:efflux transporter outer membrane subunit n=1 Tax=unclassified Ramlibacter TaxID=2617605 RepID=UPI00362F35B6